MCKWCNIARDPLRAGHTLVMLVHMHMYHQVHVYGMKSYRLIPNRILNIHGDIENCENWPSPGSHGSGSRAVTAKVRGPTAGFSQVL